MSSRSLVAIAVLGCLILVSILVALIILVTKSDTVYNVVCNSESNKEYLKMNPSTSPGTAGAHEVGTTVPSTAGGSTTARLLAPDCPLNPDSQNPDLDKAKCVLESYPLIDG